MTDIIFFQNADHMITGFKCSGHAGFRKKGHDIVCAAISALTITAVGSIEQIAKAEADVAEDESSGEISLHLKSGPDEKTEIILRSMEFGLRGISSEYGSDYCKVTIKEELEC